jgi:hypothetical protein
VGLREVLMWVAVVCAAAAIPILLVIETLDEREYVATVLAKRTTLSADPVYYPPSFSAPVQIANGSAAFRDTLALKGPIRTGSLSDGPSKWSHPSDIAAAPTPDAGAPLAATLVEPQEREGAASSALHRLDPVHEPVPDALPPEITTEALFELPEPPEVPPVAILAALSPSEPDLAAVSSAAISSAGQGGEPGEAGQPLVETAHTPLKEPPEAVAPSLSAPPPVQAGPSEPIASRPQIAEFASDRAEVSPPLPPKRAHSRATASKRTKPKARAPLNLMKWSLP